LDARERLDSELLERRLGRFFERHDALRLRLERGSGA
jgi:hypothetical protein